MSDVPPPDATVPDAPTADGGSFVIPVLSASNFVIGMGAFVVIGMLEPMATDLGLSTAQGGWILTVYALSYAVLSPFLVSVTGTMGRRRVLALGLGLFALAHLVSALAPAAGPLFAARVLAAAGAGIFTPVAAAVGAALSPPERRARSLAAVFFGLTLAQVVGVPAGSFLAYTFGWRTAFWIVVALALPCLWLIWTRIPSGLRFQPVALSDLAATLGNARTMLAVAFTSSFLAGVYVLYTYLAPLLSQTMGFGRNGVALVLATFGIGAVVGNILGGLASDRFGPVAWIVTVAGSQAVLMPFFSLLPLPEAVLLLLVLCWATMGWSFMAGQQVRLVALSPQSASVVLSLNAAAIYVGAAIGSALGGGVIELYGLGALGLAAGAVGLVALANILISARLSRV